MLAEYEHVCTIWAKTKEVHRRRQHLFLQLMFIEAWR